MKRLTPLSVAAAITAALCFIYYILCCFICSPSLPGLWIWAGFSLILSGAVLFRVFAEKRIHFGFYKYVKAAVLIIFAVFMAAFLVFEGFVVGVWVRGLSPAGTPDCIIVLGAAVDTDSPGDRLMRRIETAARYAREYPDVPLIACGGLGEGDTVTEAECIKRELIALGISGDRIITEDTSTSTEENFLRARALIPEGTTDIAVITSGFHLFRASVTAGSIIPEAELILVASPDPHISLPCGMVREFAAFVRGFM